MSKSGKWKASVKKSGCGDLVCELDLPELSSFHIKPEKSKDGTWQVGDIYSQINEWVGMAEEGQTPINASLFMSYLTDRMPGLTANYDLGDECTLQEKIDQYIDALRDDGYKVAAEGRAKYNPITSVTCTLGVDDIKSLDKAHFKAIEYLLANEGRICTVVLKALCREYAQLVKSGDVEQLSEGVKLTPKQMRSRCQCLGIDVTRECFKDMAYLECSFEVVWWAEDQWLNVVLHGDRIVFVGSTGAGWVDPEAETKEQPKKVVDPVAIFAAHRKAREGGGN